MGKFLVGLFIVSLMFSGQLCRGQATTGGLLSDRDDVQVQYAVFGEGVTFTDTTDRVRELLETSPQGFLPTADTLKANRSPDGTNELLVFYNFQGHGHFAVRRENSHKLSLGLLKEEAKLDDSHLPEIPPGDQPGGDVKIDFAVYGYFDAFNDVTETIRKLLREPEPYTVDCDSLGGDPMPGVGKSLIVIYNCDGHRHHLATRESHRVSLDDLKAQAAKDSAASR